MADQKPCNPLMKQHRCWRRTNWAFRQSFLNGETRDDEAICYDPSCLLLFSVCCVALLYVLLAEQLKPHSRFCAALRDCQPRVVVPSDTICKQYLEQTGKLQMN
jgi:hypothetical protein